MEPWLELACVLLRLTGSAETGMVGRWQRCAAQGLRGVPTLAGVDRENLHNGKNRAIAHLSVFPGTVTRSSPERLSPTGFYPSCA